MMHLQVAVLRGIAVTALHIPGQEYYRHDFGPGKMVSRLGGKVPCPS